VDEVTGGGAGSMEAANLGAYLANKSDAQVEQALEYSSSSRSRLIIRNIFLISDGSIISKGNEGFEGVEWLNPKPADNVIAALGPVTFMPSLGIPTFRYNQEPPNRCEYIRLISDSANGEADRCLSCISFATWHAKFFQNALREDGLLAICTGGIIYVKGGPGTIHDVRNCYHVNDT